MKGPAKPAERRRAPRIPVNFPVTVTWGRKQYRCKAREFSEFGVLLASTHKELAGDVGVELDLNPPSISVSLEGIVAYATDTGFAVRFKNIFSAQRTVLKAYIQAQGRNAANR